MTAFTNKMGELLTMEREAEMEETANVLAQYSFRVSINFTTVIKVI